MRKATKDLNRLSLPGSMRLRGLWLEPQRAQTASNVTMKRYESMLPPCLSQPIIAVSVRLIAFPQSRQLGAEEPRNLSLTEMFAEYHSHKELG